MAYSTPDDLLTGAIPIPSYIDASKVIADAGDEIDSKLGHIFETPFDMSDPGPLSRPARLLIKRICNNLASGRLLLALASPEENSRLHAYGWSLVQEALEAIRCIAEGDVTLEGADVNPTAPTEQATVPMINNLDAESNVEAFYNRIANPAYLATGFPGESWPNPDRLHL